MRGKILVIDDERKIFQRIESSLQAHNVYYAENLPSVKDKIPRLNIDVVIVDLNLQREEGKENFSGIDYIQTIQKRYPEVVIAVLSAYKSIDKIVNAVKNGADRYLFKGNWNLRSTEFKQLINELVDEKYRKEKKRNELKAKFEMIPSFGPKIQSQIKKLAYNRESLLLIGEKGVGKRDLVNQLHYESVVHSEKCQKHEFDLATITESELLRLMQYKVKTKNNNFLSQANGHILFVRNIEKTSPSIQEGFYRIIQTQKFLDSNEALQIQFVFVIEADIQAGEFRTKLIKELAGFLQRIELEPLRNRKDEIRSIIEKWIENHQKFKNLHVSDGVCQQLIRYDFPQNLPELYAIMEKTCLNHQRVYGELSEEREVQEESIPSELLFADEKEEPLVKAVARFVLGKINKKIEGYFGLPEYKSKVALSLGISSADNLKKTYINKYRQLYPELFKEFPMILKAYPLRKKRRTHKQNA